MTTGQIIAALIILVAVLAIALAWSRLDLDVARRDLGDRYVTITRLRGERNEIRTAMAQQRANTYTLLARLKHLEGDNEAIALTTPMPSELLSADVVAEAEAILRQVGGQS